MSYAPCVVAVRVGTDPGRAPVRNTLRRPTTGGIETTECSADIHVVHMCADGLKARRDLLRKRITMSGSTSLKKRFAKQSLARFDQSTGRGDFLRATLAAGAGVAAVGLGAGLLGGGHVDAAALGLSTKTNRLGVPKVISIFSTMR